MPSMKLFGFTLVLVFPRLCLAIRSDDNEVVNADRHKETPAALHGGKIVGHLKTAAELQPGEVAEIGVHPRQPSRSRNAKSAAEVHNPKEAEIALHVRGTSGHANQTAAVGVEERQTAETPQGAMRIAEHAATQIEKQAAEALRQKGLHVTDVRWGLTILHILVCMVVSVLVVGTVINHLRITWDKGQEAVAAPKQNDALLFVWTARDSSTLMHQ